MRHGRKRPSRRSWPRLKTAKNKAAAIRRVLRWKPDAKSSYVHRFFSGVTRSGIVTHCWRYGPRLPLGKGDPQKQFRVAALLASMRGALFLIVEIENEFHAPFDPTQVPDPTEDETVERPNGRGVFWMRSFASHVEWNKGENGEYKGNRVRLMFHHPSGGNVEQLEDACSVLDTLIGNARWLLDVVIDELKNDGSQPTSAEDVLTSPAWS